jgi:hypothetical protein
MVAMNSNPEFVALSTHRLRRLQADPIFEARRIAKRRGLDIEILGRRARPGGNVSGTKASAIALASNFTLAGDGAIAPVVC